MIRVIRTYANETDAKNDPEQEVTQAQKGKLKSAVDGAFAERNDGKSSGTREVDANGTTLPKVRLSHVSAGKQGTSDSVTLFYFFRDVDGADTFHLIALAQHRGPRHYQIDKDLGQTEMPFQRGKVVDAEGDQAW